MSVLLKSSFQALSGISGVPKALLKIQRHGYTPNMPKYIARYGLMRMLGVFEGGGKTPVGQTPVEQTPVEQAAGEDAASAPSAFPRGTRVIARTDRGLESAEVLCDASQQILAEWSTLASGQILREMTPDDRNELARIKERRPQQLETCQKCIEKLGLEMRLIDVEHIFGGERIVVYYLADGRVDFRELVRVLAGEFQTRIEMRQIGVRDEAKLLADYGDCGKAVCCNNHLIEMPPVSMKMAKLQKATLDPTKISGRCGRLKCCLRYEYEVYEQLQKTLPPIGATVQTQSGQVRIVAQEILAQALLVEDCDQVRKLIHVEEVLGVIAVEPVYQPPEDVQDEPLAEDGRDISIDS